MIISLNQYLIFPATTSSQNIEKNFFSLSGKCSAPMPKIIIAYHDQEKEKCSIASFFYQMIGFQLNAYRNCSIFWHIYTMLRNSTQFHAIPRNSTQLHATLRRATQGYVMLRRATRWYAVIRRATQGYAVLLLTASRTLANYSIVTKERFVLRISYHTSSIRDRFKRSLRLP